MAVEPGVPSSAVWPTRLGGGVSTHPGRMPPQVQGNGSSWWQGFANGPDVSFIYMEIMAPLVDFSLVTLNLGDPSHFLMIPLGLM